MRAGVIVLAEPWVDDDTGLVDAYPKPARITAGRSCFEGRLIIAGAVTRSVFVKQGGLHCQYQVADTVSYCRAVACGRRNLSVRAVEPAASCVTRRAHAEAFAVRNVLVRDAWAMGHAPHARSVRTRSTRDLPRHPAWPWDFMGPSLARKGQDHNRAEKHALR